MTEPAYSPDRRLTVEEYLEWEEHQAERHEYVAGQVFAMSGATLRHTMLVANVYDRLRAAPGSGSCRPFTHDVKVRVARDVFYYPDVVVLCGPIDGSAVWVDDPCLIVEVTSPSTERTDRREKLLAYQQLANIRGYLIVSHRRRVVDVHWRDESGAWQSDRLTEGAIDVPCPETRLTLDEIYAGVTLPAVAEPEPAAYDA